MQIVKVELPKTHRLYLASDTHEGSASQHQHGIEALVDAVGRDRKGHLALLGDLIEGITIDDPRYNRGTEDARSPTILKQYKNITRKFRPIRKKIVVAMPGNHDIKHIDKFGDGVRDIFCDELGVPYGTYACRLAAHDKGGNLQYKAYLHHGFGTINSKNPDPVVRQAQNESNLMKRLSPLAGDTAIMACGHTHKLIVRKPQHELYLVDDGEKIQQRYTQSVAMQTAEYIPPYLRYYCNTGSFYKLHVMGQTGYGERAGYSPNELGYVVLEVEDGIIRDMRRVVLQ